jgi:hypothetical protein
MASPFKVFRKNKKVMFAALTLMAMIAFVVIPAVLQNASTWQRNQDPVVVTTAKYGDLTQSTLSSLRGQHERILGILAAIINRVNPNYEYQRVLEILQMQMGGSKESDTVERWLIAHKASEIGIDVGDDAVRDFIKQETEGKLPTKDLEAILKQHAGDRYTDAMFFDDLREELKVLQFRSMFSLSTAGIPPAQRWDYYLRAHEQAEIQCIPVAVRDFAGTIKKPDDEKTLKDFFEKYKDQVATPYSPEPGFRVPQKVAIEYFVANLDKFAAPDKITEEELQTYYEKDSKRYDELNKKILLNQAENSAEKKDSEKKDGEKKDGEKKEPTDKDKPAEGQEPAEETKPAAEGAQPAPADGEKKEGEPKESEKNSEPTAPSESAKPAETPAANPADTPADSGDGKSSSIERSPYRTVSLAAADDKENPEPPKADATKTEPSKADVPAGDAPKTDAPAATGDAAVPKQKPPVAEPKPADAAPTETKPAEAAAGTPAEQPPAAEGQKPGTPARQMTDWVRQLTEETRQEIRKAVAVDKIAAIFQKLEPQMKENAMEWKRYEAAKLHEQTGLQVPPRLDFAALAKEYGIESSGMSEKTYWEARNTEIGKAVVLNLGQLVVDAVYDAGQRKQAEITTHSPFVAKAGSDFFLAWKSNDIKESAPKWDNPAVQQQVLEAWKLEKARDLAIAKAKALAEQAKKAKAPLKDVFAGVADIKVVSPPAFSWLTPGLNPMNPQYRQTIDVSGVEYPGDEFMKTVFTLNPMDVGTAMNMPKSLVYVVQVQKFEPGTETLWQRFLQDEYPRYASAGSADREAAQLALRTELEKEAGLKWERKADQPQKEKDDKDESSGD